MECIIVGVVALIVLAVAAFAMSAGSSGQIGKLTQRFDGVEKRLNKLDNSRSVLGSRQSETEKRLDRVEAKLVELSHHATWEESPEAETKPATAWRSESSTETPDEEPSDETKTQAPDESPLPAEASAETFEESQSTSFSEEAENSHVEPEITFEVEPEVTSGTDTDSKTASEGISSPSQDEDSDTALNGDDAESVSPQDIGETIHASEVITDVANDADVAAERPTTFEERLGARLFVWIGAIALALAGTYLVKYGIEKQVLTPTVRIVLGGLFGFSLLGAGEFMRSKSMRIAQGLSAAGIADLFAVTLSATNHHGLLPPSIGFVCMAAVTAMAVFLSIRQGWFVAMLGMVGGFLTPALVGMEDQHPAQLFSYLLILEVGLVIITRKQGWWHLSALTMLAAMGWATKWTLVNLAGPIGTDHTAWLGMFILGSIAAFVCASLPKSQAADDAESGSKWSVDPLHIISWVAAISGLALIGRLIHAGNFAAGDWIYLGLLGAGAIVLGRIDRRYFALPWVTCAATLALIIGWHVSSSDPTHATDAFCFVTLFMGVLYAVGGWCCIWSRQRSDELGIIAANHHKPIIWAGLSVLSTLAFMLVTFFAMDELPTFAWWQVSTAIGLVFVAAAFPIYRRRATLPNGNEVLAVFATGAAACFALAVPFELEKQWITVAWALMIPAIAVIEIRLKVPALRKMVGVLAAVVAVRLLINPAVLTYPIGDTLLWNWLLYGYGVPMLCFGVTAWIYNRYSVSLVVAELLEALAIAFGFALATLQIRHGFHGELVNTSATLHESGTYTITWLVACIGLLWAGRRWQRPIIASAAKVVGVLALGAALFGSLTVLNPIVSPGNVGQTVGFNLLLFDYALPTVLAGVIGFMFFKQREQLAATVAWAAAGVFAFAWMTFTVRHGFHRSFDRELTTLIEWATYSTAWLAIGFVLLAISRRLKLPVLRHAATGMLCITALIAMATQLVGRNPLLTHEAVNGPLLANGLLYIYGLPAMLSALMAWQFQRARDTIAATIAGCVTLAFTFVLVTMEIRHGFHAPNFKGESTLVEWGTYLNVWLIMSLALFIAAKWKRSPALYHAASLIGYVSLILGSLVLVGVHNPIFKTMDVGNVVIFNWLLFAYGGPALLAAIIAVWLAKIDRKEHGVIAAIASIATTFLMVTLMVRHGFHSPNLVGDATLNEHATYTVAWLSMGIAMLVAARRWKFKSLVRGGMTVCCVAMAHGLTTLGLTENPLRVGHVIHGSIVLNDLLYIYGVPALLAGIAAWQAGKHRDITVRRFAGVAAILFAFALCSLQVRHAFGTGGVLTTTSFSTAEQYAYSAAWTVFGVILLVLAIWKQGHVLRYASLVVMMLAVGKVFLFDAGRLENLYRVASFLGLGVSLLVLAFLYQRFVFRRAD